MLRIVHDEAKVVFGVAEQDLRGAILQIIMTKSNQVFAKNIFFSFLIDHLEPNHLNDDRLALLDASEIIEALVGHYSISVDDFVIRYIESLRQRGTLWNVFPDELRRPFEATRPEGLPKVTVT